MAGSTLTTTIRLLGKLDPSLSKAMKSAESMAGKTGKNIGSIFKKGVLVVGAAVVTGASIAVKAAAEYETSLAKVSTIADTTAKSMEEISKDTLRLSNETGLAAAEVNEATYQAISAGIKTEDATKVVGVAAKAAKGGFSDVSTAVDGLTTVLNSYGLEAEKADKIANQMLITQNLGKTTFDELSQSIGRIAPIAKAAGVGTEEMFSSLASITGTTGMETSEAVSGMKAAISNVIKPTAEASKVASQLGLDFSASALQSKGLAGFLADVKEKTGGNIETMSQLFGSVEGLNAVLSLTSDEGMALMTKAMNEMKSNSTALDDAYSKMANTPAERFARLKNELSNSVIQIGEALMPLAEMLLGALENIDIQHITDVLVEQINGFVQSCQIAGQGISDIFNFIKTAISTVLNVLFNLPEYAIQAFTGIMNGATMAGGAIMNLAGGAINFLWGALQGVIPFLQNIGAAVFPIITGAVNAASGAVQALGGAFQTAWSIIQPIVGFIVEKVTWMGQQVQNALGGLSGIASGIGGAISGIGSFLGISKHATGGTFTQPHLAVIGDAPETIVPHGNTPHNRRLLAEAARGVGATTPSTGSQGGSVNIVFNATITGGNAQEVRQGVLQAESELESRLDEYFNKRKRVAF